MVPSPRTTSQHPVAVDVDDDATNQLVLLRFDETVGVDDKGRDERSAQHAIGDASERRARETAPPVRSHHDRVGIDTTGGVDDAVDDRTAQVDCCRVDAGDARLRHGPCVQRPSFGSEVGEDDRRIDADGNHPGAGGGAAPRTVDRDKQMTKSHVAHVDLPRIPA